MVVLAATNAQTVTAIIGAIAVVITAIGGQYFNARKHRLDDRGSFDAARAKFDEDKTKILQTLQDDLKRISGEQRDDRKALRELDQTVNNLRLEVFQLRMQLEGKAAELATSQMRIHQLELELAAALADGTAKATRIAELELLLAKERDRYHILEGINQDQRARLAERPQLPE